MIYIIAFNFSTLYTKFPHDKLLEELFVYVVVNNCNFQIWKCILVKEKTKVICDILKKHLIENCYFSMGEVTMCQIIGIL